MRLMSEVLRNDFALLVELDPALIGHQLHDFFGGCVCGFGDIAIERLPAVSHNRLGSDTCWVKPGRNRHRGSNVLSGRSLGLELRHEHGFRRSFQTDIDLRLYLGRTEAHADSHTLSLVSFPER